MLLPRASRLALFLCLALATSCTRLPHIQKTTITARTPSELQGYLRTHKPDLDVFRSSGPFAVNEHRDREFRVSATERVSADLYLAAPAEKAPLVILLHGYDSSKEAHANQAMHLASWGLHAMAVQLPNKGAWVANGRTLARVVALIHRSPDLIDPRIDVNRIILIGHSFGASAVSAALSLGAPAMGGILLDPAAVGRDLPSQLQQIRKPVMVLGADEERTATRNREYFYRYVRSGVGEVSIRDATHEDAQYPSEATLRTGNDPYTNEESQVTFTAAMTSAALSLASTGGFDYAWTSFGGALQNGKFFNARRK